MKRFLLSFLTLLLVLPVAFAEDSTWSWTYSSSSITLPSTNPTTSGTFSIDSKTWDLTSESTVLVTKDGNFKGVGFGGSKSSTKYFSKNVEISTAAFKDKCIKKVSFETGTSSTSVAPTCTVYIDNTQIANVTVNKNTFSNHVTVSWEGQQNCSTSLRICFSAESTPDKVICIGNISITYGDWKEDDVEGTVSVKAGKENQEVSVGGSLAVGDLFEAAVEGDVALSAKVSDALTFKLKEESDKDYVSIAEGGKTLTVTGYKGDGIKLLAGFANVSGVEDADSSDEVTLTTLPTMALYEYMPTQMSTGQTVSVPLTVYPAEAISSVTVEVADDKALTAVVDTENSAVTFTANNAIEDNIVELSFGGSYNAGKPVETTLTVVEGDCPRAVTADIEPVDGVITIYQNDVITFTSEGAAHLDLVALAPGNNRDIDNSDASVLTHKFQLCNDYYVLTVTPYSIDDEYEKNGLKYYYYDRQFKSNLVVKVAPKEEVELSIVGDTERTIEYNGTIEGGWVSATIDNALYNLIYRSDDTKIATVDINGNITAKKPGTAKITVKPNSDRYTGNTVTLTVTVGKIPTVLSIADTAKTSIKEGETSEGWLSVDLGDLTDDANFQKDVREYIFFSVADDSTGIATIDRSGNVTGAGVGEAHIIATLIANDTYAAETIRITYTLTVEQNYKPKVTDTLTAENSQDSSKTGYQLYQLKGGDGTDCKTNSKVTYFIKSNKNTDKTIQINNSNTTTNSAYNAGIVSTDNPENRKIQKIVITTTKTEDNSKLIVTMGNTANSYSGTVGGTGSNVTVTSNNSNTITASVSDKTYTYTPDKDYEYFAITTNNQAVYINSVEVTYKAEGTAPDKKDVTLAVNENAKAEMRIDDTFENWLVAKVGDEEDATAQSKLIYASSNATVASVDSTGKVTALKEGAATITVTIDSEDIYYQLAEAFSYNVTVLKKEVALSLKEGVEESCEFDINDTLEDWAVAKVADEANADAQKSVAYTSSAPEVASVDATGVVTALKSGEATITAYIPAGDANYTADPLSVKVTVSENLAELITKSNFRKWSGSSYVTDSYSSTSGVTYAVKGASASTATAITINSKSTSNPNSGIATTANAYGRAISKIIVTPSDASANITVKVGNTPNSFIEGENAAGSSVLPALDAEELAGESFIYTPTEECYYFAVTSTGSTQIESIKVVYKPATTRALTPRLTVNTDSKAIQYNKTTSFDDFVDVSFADSNDDAKGARMNLVVKPVYSKSAEFIAIDQDKSNLQGIKVTSDVQTFIAYIPASEGYNGSNAVIFTTTVDKCEATVLFDEETYTLPYGEEVKLQITAEPEEAISELQFVIDSDYADYADNIIFKHNEDGSISVTGVTVDEESIIYYASFPETSNYYTEDEDLVLLIQVVPGRVVASVEASSDDNIYVKKGGSITFSSAKATKINVELLGSDTTDSAEGEGDSYTYTFNEVGEFTVEVNPYYGTHTFTEIRSEYNVKVVTEEEVSLPAANDELTLPGFGVNSTSLDMYKISAEESKVEYATKSKILTGSWTLTANSSDNSGIASTYNPVGVPIEKLIIVKKADKSSNAKMVVQMSNEPNKADFKDNDGITLAGDSRVIDADSAPALVRAQAESADDVESDDAEETVTYTYTPEEDYKYFSVTAQGANVTVISVAAIYKEIVYRDKPELQFDYESLSLCVSDYANGEQGIIDQNVLSFDKSAAKARSVVDTSTATYESKNKTVATVDEYGTVTPLRAGTATIVGHYPGSTEYEAADKEYEVTVTLLNQPADGSSILQPLIFDEANTLLTYQYIEDPNSVIETHEIHVVYDKGYTIKYTYTAGTQGSKNSKGIRRADAATDQASEGTELEDKASTDAGYYEGVVYPYGEDESQWQSGTMTVWATNGTLESSKVTLNFAIPTAVEFIEADEPEESESEAVYYNLQGQRVKNPVPGIYIRVSGNKATKVAL